MKHFFFTLVACVCLWSPAVYAETTILSVEIPGLYQKDGMGAYDKIVNDVLVKPGLASIQLRPPARAEKEFEECQDCCYSPGNDNPDFYDYGDDVIKTNPMNTAKLYIFTGKGQKVLNSLEDLKGKKVGTRFGMPYGNTFENAGLNLEPTKTIENNIKKLDKGRIDAFVAYVPDAYIAFKNLGIASYPHDPAKPIAVHEDCLVCRGVSQEVIDNFNNELKKMSESGQLKEMLGDSFVD